MSFDAPHHKACRLINTLLQRGVGDVEAWQNRFNGFCSGRKTAEAVRAAPPHFYAPLKQGVNGRRKAMSGSFTR